MTEKFERIVEFSPAYDQRNPNPNKDYGIGSMTIRFVLKGPKGAIQFVLTTDWHLPHIQKTMPNLKSTGMSGLRPWATDIGYHSKHPMYDGDSPIQRDCPYTDGICYYDGSGLRADKMIPDFLANGSDWLWKELENDYQMRFGEVYEVTYDEEG